MGESSRDSSSLRWRLGTEAQGVGGGASSVRRRTLLAAPPRSPPLSPTQCPLPSSLPSGLVLEQEPQPDQQKRRQRSFCACSSHRSLARGGAGGWRAGGRRGPAGNCAEPCRTVRTGALRRRRRLAPVRTADLPPLPPGQPAAVAAPAAGPAGQAPCKLVQLGRSGLSARLLQPWHWDEPPAWETLPAGFRASRQGKFVCSGDASDEWRVNDASRGRFDRGHYFSVLGLGSNLGRDAFFFQAEALEKGNQCPSGMSLEQTIWPMKVGGKS